MSYINGKKFIVDIFGESHSGAIGVVINGIPPGVPVDIGDINAFLARRRPNGGVHSTTRRESDTAEMLSGCLNGVATGAPLAVIIRNADVRSADYENIKRAFRPSHSDYAAYVKYGGYNDYRGGGQFSGRLTAPLCIAGSIALKLLKERGIKVTAYISSVGQVKAKSYADYADIEKLLTEQKIEEIKSSLYPLLDKSAEEAIIEEIASAAREGDSVGGVIECAVTGLLPGIGEPLYDSLEGLIAKTVFAVPSVKGVEFGDGFGITSKRGSEANDPMYYDGERVRTYKNSNGGITGGISNGMPLTFRAAFKPVSSISKEQDTVDADKKKNVKIIIDGRHDACILPRAVPVVEAAAACVLLDLIL
ncbi:MAG: chorismate synthase [Clostridiales bacterium]|nr:chorismate synthase [Clostridiales bacterium]